MYASSSYARSASTMNSVASSAIWIIVSLVLAIVGGIVLYFTFLKKDNEGKYQLNQTNKLDISKEGLGVSNYRIIYENYNDISKAKYGYVIISNGEKVSRVEITINDIYKYTADLELGRESMVLIKENLTPEESSGIRLDVKYFDDDNNELFQ